MNCHELEMVLRDLARDPNRESGLWDSYSKHLEGCPACSARVVEEMALEARIRQLASNVKDTGAPIQLEAKLLDAFRRERDSRQVPHFSWWRLAGWRWALAGGSMALLAFALTWYRLPHRGSSPERPQSQRVNTFPALAPDRLSSPPGMDEKKAVVEKSLHGGPGQKEELGRLPQRQNTPVRRVEKVTARERALKDLEGEATYFEPEVATEFIPFMAVGGLYPGEQQLVRVKLPRSTLETFGLPVNRERVREPVQADVLIGEDGLARAIRFVH